MYNYTQSIVVYKPAFEGYWREVNKSWLPTYGGLYCVYASVYNASANTVTLLRLLYIGQAQNINERISNHEKLPDWKEMLGKGEQLCYASCAIPNAYERDICESALIYHHEPPCNKEYRDNFPHRTAEFMLQGETGLMDAKKFIVYQTR